MDAAQFVAERFGTLRSHWFAPSIGGNAKGGDIPVAGVVDMSCFRTGNVTEQMTVIAHVGEKAAIESCRCAGIMPPAWLIAGGR